MTAVLHLVLAAAAASLVVTMRERLAAVFLDRRGTARPERELRRMWRKEATGPALAVASWVPGTVLACDGTALLLVPTVLPTLPEPFGNLLAVFGLLAAGRVLAVLAAFERNDGGALAARCAVFLAAAGPAAALVVCAVGGIGGSANLLPALSGLRELGGPILPAVLAAAAVAVLGWADVSTAPAPDTFASGRASAVLRVSAAVRCAAWLDLVSVLLPPAAPELAGQTVLAWAVKFAVLLVALAVHDASGRAPRPLAAPALAALLALLGTLLVALRGAGA